MLNFKQLSSTEKFKIVIFAEGGFYSREIEKRTECYQFTVVRVLKKNLAQCSAERKNGRKRKSFERLDRLMMPLSLEDRFRTAKKISRNIADRNLVNIRREARQAVKGKRFMGKETAKKPFLN